jgi:poly(hydroxyalkanoate) granule-associated protein
MAPKASTTKAKPKKEEERPLYEATRRMLLASIGAVALAQDEAEAFVNKLVERGELADQEGFKLIKEIKARREKNFRRVEDELAQRLDAALTHLNIPTRADMDALGEKIAALNKKIDELKKE